MINEDDPQLYEHLSMIIAAYEEQAIKSGTRKGFMVAAKGPLTGFQQILMGSDKILADSERRSQPRRDPASTGRLGVETEGSLTDPTSNFSIKLETDPVEADFNVDLLELMAEEGPVGDFAARYLSECLGCNGRLQFGWQLKPMNLLGSIDKFLDQIEGSLDRFSARLDPMTQLAGLCGLLNSFKVFCIQDILMMLMSIKMLIKKYMQNTLRIRLDWTTILGPLLKAVLDGVANLLGDVGATIAAPLDCLQSSIKAADQLYRETRELVDDLKKITTKGNVSIDGQMGVNMRAVKWENGGLSATDTVQPFPGTDQEGTDKAAAARLENKQLRQSNKEQRQNSLGLFGEKINRATTSFPTGFSVDGRMTVQDALKHPGFGSATPLQKVLVPLQEAKEWIAAEIAKINKAVQSLGELTGDGLSVNLDGLGVLLFLTDMVGLISLIVRMIKTGDRRTDWCRVLAENPQMLEDQLARTSQGVRVERQGDSLLLKRGRDIVGEVPLCSNKRTQEDGDLLGQWIAELERLK